VPLVTFLNEPLIEAQRPERRAHLLFEDAGDARYRVSDFGATA
jgi:hypothetical protein